MKPSFSWLDMLKLSRVTYNVNVKVEFIAKIICKVASQR